MAWWGLFLNASIERQFEFVQRKWLNWGQFDGLGNDPDSITGPDGRDSTWQRRTGPRRYPGLPRFVPVCGGDGDDGQACRNTSNGDGHEGTPAT